MTISEKVRSRSIVLVGIILTTLNLRAAVTSLSDIFGVVAKDVSGFSIPILGMLPLLSFAIFGLLAPQLSHRLGYEMALFISMMCIGVGLTARLFMNNFWGFAISTVVALAGMAFGNVLLPPLFKKYFPDHINGVTSLYSVLIAVSAGFPSIISSNTVGKYGWRFSLGIWAIVGFAAALPWLMQIIANNDFTRPTTEKVQTNSVPAYKSSITWMVALLFGVGGMLPMYTMINWLPTYLVSVGYTTAAAGTMLFLYNTLGIFHSFLVPLVLSKMKHPYSLVILAVVLQIGTYFGFWLIPQWSFAWSIIAAPSLLTIPASFQLFNMHSKIPNGTASISSMAQFIGYLFAAVGPLVFCWLKNATGNYSLSFIFVIVLSILTLFFGFGAMRPGFVEDAKK